MISPASIPEPVAAVPGRRSLAQNAAALLLGQLVGLVVPLLTIPYLARVLGPEGWGPVLAAQGLGNWLVLVLEFGFDLSGTRAVARARSNPGAMTEVVHGAQSAKALLTCIIAVVSVIAFLAIPSLRRQPALVGWTVVYAAFRGFNPLWFFQGIERIKAAVAVDSVTRAAAALSVFALVKAPADGWRVIALQAFFAVVSLAVLTTWLAKHVALRAPRFADGLTTISGSWNIFACRASSGVYIQANTLLLSALASSATVAFFGGAERIIRAAINLLQPLTQAFLPRISYLQAADPEAAQRTIRRSLIWVGLLGGAMGLVAIVGAPLLVRVLLGPEYTDAVPVLRLLGLLPPLVAVNTVLGIYWALPLGHDRLFLSAILGAGVANVTLAIILVPRWGGLGMAAAAIAAEVVVMLVLATQYIRRAR